MSSEEDKVIIFEKTSATDPKPEGQVKLVNTTRTAKYYAKKVTRKEAEQMGVKRRAPQKKPAAAIADPVMDMLTAKMAGLNIVTADDVLASSQEEGSSNSQAEISALISGLNVGDGEWGGEGSSRRRRKTRKTRGRKRRTTRKR